MRVQWTPPIRDSRIIRTDVPGPRCPQYAASTVSRTYCNSILPKQQLGCKIPFCNPLRCPVKCDQSQYKCDDVCIDKTIGMDGAECPQVCPIAPCSDDQITCPIGVDENVSRCSFLIFSFIHIGHNGRQMMARHASCPISTGAVTVPG